MDGFNGRVGSAQEKRTGKTNLFEVLSFDKGLEALDIDGDIGVLRHRLLLMVTFFCKSLLSKNGFTTEPRR